MRWAGRNADSIASASTRSAPPPPSSDHCADSAPHTNFFHPALAGANAAMLAGYADPAHLTRHIKRFASTTPAEISKSQHAATPSPAS